MARACLPSCFSCLPAFPLGFLSPFQLIRKTFQRFKALTDRSPASFQYGGSSPGSTISETEEQEQGEQVSIREEMQKAKAAAAAETSAEAAGEADGGAGNGDPATGSKSQKRMKAKRKKRKKGGVEKNGTSGQGAYSLPARPTLPGSAKAVRALRLWSFCCCCGCWVTLL